MSIIENNEEKNKINKQCIIVLGIWGQINLIVIKLMLQWKQLK